MTGPRTVTADTACRIALSLPDAEEGAHFGKADFRVDGKIFATLPASDRMVLKLTIEQQDMLCGAEAGFAALDNAWGRKGWTEVRLNACSEDVLGHALTLAWGNVAGRRRIAGMRR